MPAVVRPARPDEAAALHLLAAATFPLACPPGTSAEDADAFVAEHLSPGRFEDYLADPDRILLVADDRGRLVGYTMLVLGEPTDADVARVITARPVAELSKCYVDPLAHGSGVAAELVAQSVAAAGERGCATVWLGVNQQNARANRFYEREGFRCVGVKRFLVGAQLHDDFVREHALLSDLSTTCERPEILPDGWDAPASTLGSR